METADIIKAVLAVTAVAGMGLGTNQFNKSELVEMEQVAVEERKAMRSSCLAEKESMRLTCEAFIASHCGEN